jgi:ABC-2 type transport system ATP-binding protein
MAGMRGEAYDDSAARAMLERVDLDNGALTRTVRTYSKGMTQKLGLAACFLARRDLTVLDEPMSGLDPKARALVKDLLGDIRRAGGTLFFTSHALADVEEICDQVAVLHSGRLRFVGAPGRLRGDTGEPTLERAFLRLISAPATIAP